MITMWTISAAAGLISDMGGVVILTLDLVPEYQQHVANRALSAARATLTAPINRYLNSMRPEGDDGYAQFDIDAAKPARIAELWALAAIDGDEWSKMRRSVEVATNIRLWPQKAPPMRSTGMGELKELADVYGALELSDRFNAVEWRCRPAI